MWTFTSLRKNYTRLILATFGTFSHCRPRLQEELGAAVLAMVVADRLTLDLVRALLLVVELLVATLEVPTVLPMSEIKQRRIPTNNLNFRTDSSELFSREL